MPTDLRLDGELALVTGAGQGIGRAIALRLAEHGAAGVPAPDVARRTQRPFVETSPADWYPDLRISLLRVLLVTRAFLPGMVASGWGRLITIISEAARQGEPGLAAYAAAKAGAAGFMRSIAREVGRAGVTANCVSLGGIRTESLEALLPAETLAKIARGYSLGRLGTPTDVADTVLFLASRAASWTTGQVYPVNGGYLAS